MATKASGTLILILEKQHASWDLMCSTLPALELRFRRQPHIASARPLALLAQLNACRGREPRPKGESR